VYVVHLFKNIRICYFGYGSKEFQSEPTHHLRKYLAAPLRPARGTKITLLLYPVEVVRDTTTTQKETYTNGGLAMIPLYHSS
jgi:hypothetical protein